MLVTPSRPAWLELLLSRAPAPQVIIEGFKTYKEQTVTEPFSPKVNSIGAWLPRLAAN